MATASLSAPTTDNVFLDEAEIPLLNDVVRGSVDYKLRPAIRRKYGGWKSASFIIGVAVGERFCYYGVSSNLVSYLTGELGQSTAAAAANLNAWYGTTQLSPIFGAFIADSFLGRYRMIVIATLLYILGLGFLPLSAALAECTNACPHPQLPVILFFISLYFVAFAQGGLCSCMQAFGADQFDDEDEKECRAQSSFFNWYLFFSCMGSFTALLVLNYIQENLSWVVGFGIPAIVMCFALVVFSLGTITYRFRISNGGGSNPFVRIVRVFIRATRNWRVSPVRVPTNEEEALPILSQRSCQFKFLDKALVAPSGTLADEKICSIDDVEDAKTIARLVPIWVTSLGYSIVFSQPSTLFTKQASTMDRRIILHLQIPAASLQLCILVSAIVFLPIYDRVLVPIARAITKKPSGISTLQRIGTGFFLSLISIVVAAIVERKRLHIAAEYGLVDLPNVTIPMSVWCLAPQYLIAGIGDVFSLIGLQEFFYDQVPCELKSAGVALYLSILGIGNLLSSLLVSLVEHVTSGGGRDSWFSNNLNRAHLDYFYWLLAGLSAAAFAAYVHFARAYVYRRRKA